MPLKCYKRVLSILKISNAILCTITKAHKTHWVFTIKGDGGDIEVTWCIMFTQLLGETQGNKKKTKLYYNSIYFGQGVYSVIHTVSTILLFSQ